MNYQTFNSKKPDILIVDDQPDSLEVLGDNLRYLGYGIRQAKTGETAIKAAINSPPDLIILDIKMPGMDGYEVCKYFKQDCTLSVIPIIFISGQDSSDDKVKAFDLGGVDYITKPFNMQEIQARIKTHLDLHRLRVELGRQNQNLQSLVNEKAKEISESQMATIFALSKLSESRDDDTGKHLERVQMFCKLLALRLKEEPKCQKMIDEYFIDNIFNASPLHDIGKVAIEDGILKKPGTLTQEEFGKMKFHTNIGARTLETVYDKYPDNAFINMGITIARSHHERWDGTGYPNGLAGEDIPLAARIMAVADVYDALTSERCYKKAKSHEESRDIILKDSGTHFDPMVVEAFRQLEDQFREIREKMD